MKISRLSKLMFICLATATIGGFSVDALAGNGSAPKRTVRDMMLHNRGAKAQQQRVRRTAVNRPKPQNVQIVAPTAYAAMPVQYATPVQYAAPASRKVAKAKLVDHDGSLFPGGSCVSCLSSNNSGDKDGSLFPGGSCVNCYDSGPLIDTGPCEACEVAETVAMPVSKCCAMAPFWLDHVDFNLHHDQNVTPYTNKLGNYRFRIFGCRRYDKEALLNHGRIMEKDINFNQIFDRATGDCYNLVSIPQDLCLQTTPTPLPEYVLTAEITDFFMNVCDQYDWDQAEKTDTRKGSAEMTVKWRLSNLTKTVVLWEGTTNGYSEVPAGVEDGELKLIQGAFADATTSLQMAYGFEEQLMVRLSPEELAAQRNALIDEEIALNPAKCNVNRELDCAQKVDETCLCPCACPPQAAIVEDSGIKISHTSFDNCIDENGGVIADSRCSKPVSVEGLCIVDRMPYAELTPEVMNKLQTSVVEVSNLSGKTATGLVVAENFVVTAADVLTNDQTYQVKTANGAVITAHSVRVNPVKNVALMMLDQEVEYVPLSISLGLPRNNANDYTVVSAAGNAKSSISGYRYSEANGTEIIVDTNTPDVSLGGVLFDNHGTINGFAHSVVKTENGRHLFLPTETTLRSIDLPICDKTYEKEVVSTPVTDKILKSTPKAPEAMKAKDRK